MRVLVTRPLADGTRTADLLAARGHVAVLAPVTQIVVHPLAADIAATPGLTGLIATSAHAFDPGVALADALRALPVHCVGRRTEEAASAAGFRIREPADPDALTLANRLAGEASGHFLYLAGADRKPHLERALAGHGHRVTLAVVYEAMAVSSLPINATVALTSAALEAVLHYSRRHADLFRNLVERAGLTSQAALLRHICLSKDVAEPLEAVYPDLRLAERPDEQALLAALERS